MMTWTLFLLILTSEGQWDMVEGRTFSKPKVCERASTALKGKTLASGSVIVHSVCREVTRV